MYRSTPSYLFPSTQRSSMNNYYLFPSCILYFSSFFFFLFFLTSILHTEISLFLIGQSRDCNKYSSITSSERIFMEFITRDHHTHTPLHFLAYRFYFVQSTDLLVDDRVNRAHDSQCFCWIYDYSIISSHENSPLFHSF